MILDSPRKQVGEEESRLISKYFQDGNDFKFLTTMPSTQFLLQLKRLKQDYWQAVYKCLESIFSYVTERPYVEDQATFFIHVASAILYEVDNQIQIKGKDHAKKGASIVQSINNTLTIFAEYTPDLDQDIELVEIAESLLIKHGKLIEDVLRLVPEKTKSHLREHNKYNGDLLTDWNIHASDIQRLRQEVYINKTPKKTPQRLSKADSLSVQELIQESTAVRRLIFDEEGSPPQPRQKPTSPDCTPEPVRFTKQKCANASKRNPRDSLSMQFANMQVSMVEQELEDALSFSLEQKLEDAPSFSLEQELEDAPSFSLEQELEDPLSSSSDEDIIFESSEDPDSVSPSKKIHTKNNL